MNTSRIDYLNIFLMVVSCLLAFQLPFELFLFSYAILGPLHYLTEIGWLHQRNYFIPVKKDYLILVLCSLAMLLVFMWAKFPQVNSYISSSRSLESFRMSAAKTTPVIVFVAFAAALIMILFKRWWMKLTALSIALTAGFLLKNIHGFVLLFAVMVPTVIHVWLFTGLFMLSGALKSKQFSSVLAIGVFIMCSISFFIFKYKLGSYPVSPYIQNSFIESGFNIINDGLRELFSTGSNFSLNKGFGIKIQRFIAFAYTYHYLNWFSKTNIIKWHAVPKSWLVTTVVLWLASIGLYWFDYKTGTLALFFLSILHVFLEFPLNIRSIEMIWKDVGGTNPKQAAETRSNNSKEKVLFKPKTN